MPDPVRGFEDLPCPLCARDGCITVHLDNVSQFSCTECGEEFDTTAVQQFIDRWTPVLAFLRTAPVVEDQS